MTAEAWQFKPQILVIWKIYIFCWNILRPVPTGGLHLFAQTRLLRQKGLSRLRFYHIGCFSFTTEVLLTRQAPAWLASRNWLGTPTRCSSAHFPPWILFLKLHRAVPLFTLRVLIKNSCSKGFWQTLCQFLAGPSQNGSHVRGVRGVPMGKSKSGCDQVLATLFIHFTHWSR